MAALFVSSRMRLAKPEILTTYWSVGFNSGVGKHYRLPVSEGIYAREQLNQAALDKRSVVQLNGVQRIATENPVAPCLKWRFQQQPRRVARKIIP
jgi:hypothetical protein